jgi:hypothetical protein
MKKVHYSYGTRLLGCECCSESDNNLEITEDGKVLVNEGGMHWFQSAPTFCDEAELRAYVESVYGWTDLEMDTENVYV